MSPISVSSARKVLAAKAKLFQSCNICLPLREGQEGEKLFSSSRNPFSLVIWPAIWWILFRFLQPDLRGKSYEKGKIPENRSVCIAEVMIPLPNLFFQSPQVAFCIFWIFTCNQQERQAFTGLNFGQHQKLGSKLWKLMNLYFHTISQELILLFSI